MRASKLVRPILAATAVVVAAAGAATLVQTGAVASSVQTTSEVTTAIQPPQGSVQVASYRVKVGFQIYRCVNGAWSFKAPAAMAVNSDDKYRVIYHYAGPTWQSMTDGSLVTATKVAESSVPGAIPELLLQVNSHSGTVDGELAPVTYIQRVNTKGGLAPSGSCVDGAEQPVQYGADYVFWAPAQA